MTNGALKGVEHFDSKAEVAEYIETMKGDMVATYFMPGFYMQNIRGMIRPGQDGVPTLIQPWDGDRTKVALLDAAKDSGTFVAGILSQDPKSVNGLYVQACSEWTTPNAMVEVLSKTGGTTVKFQQVPEDLFKSFLPPPVAEEMTENMVLVRDYSYYGPGQEKHKAASDKLLGGTKKKLHGRISWLLIDPGPGLRRGKLCTTICSSRTSILSCSLTGAMTVGA
jgi:hypothetical protein